jgi:hypothetical protein
MSDVDRLIREVLDEELPEREPPARRGFFVFTFAALTGPGGWVNLGMLVAQALLFGAGVYAAFRFFGASEVLPAVKWGLSSSTLLILGLVTKMGIVPSIESNRVIRELHRLELRIEEMRREEGRGAG